MFGGIMEGCSDKVTIKDIARMAGVSIRTVSRVINNNPRVSAETRRKVEEIISEKGFQPNIVAQSLRRRKTNTLVIFIERQDVRHWSQYHPRVVNSLVDRAHLRGYHVVISYSNPHSFEENQNDGFYLLRNGYADAAIVLDTNHEDRRVEYMLKNNIPFVILGHSPQPEKSSWVRLDDRLAGRLIGSFILQRELLPAVGFFGGGNFIVTEDRLQGILEGLSHRAGEFEARMDCRDMEGTYRRASGALSGFRCAFVSGDDRAPGVYRAARDAGLSIPKDLAVIGFDNNPLAAFLSPPLTSVDQPYDSFAEDLIRIIDDLQADPGCIRQITHEPFIIERGSTPGGAG